jgi:chromosome segregation ATPase
MEDTKTHITPMEKRLTEMEEKLEDISITVKEIKDALIGNALTKGRGLVDDFREVKAQVNAHEDFYKRIKWLIWIAGAIGSLFGFFLELAWNYYINKHK